MNVLLETFGSIVSEDNRKANLTLEDVVRVGLQNLDDLIGIDEVDQIITGMNADVTEALQQVVDEDDLNIEVRAFYPNVNDFREDEDEMSYREAWQEAYGWRNDCVFNPDHDSPTADLTVRFGDAGSNGAELLAHSRRKGVTALDINLDDTVDKSAAYGDDEADSESEADNDSETDTADASA